MPLEARGMATKLKQGKIDVGHMKNLQLSVSTLKQNDLAKQVRSMTEKA